MATTHSTTDVHPLAGSTVKVEFEGLGHLQLGPGVFDFDVENWWDALTGKSWQVSDGNPAALIYGVRVGTQGLPMDDEVVYGKIQGLGVLVHASEIRS